MQPRIPDRTGSRQWKFQFAFPSTREGGVQDEAGRGQPHAQDRLGRDLRKGVAPSVPMTSACSRMTSQRRRRKARPHSVANTEAKEGTHATKNLTLTLNRVAQVRAALDVSKR